MRDLLLKDLGWKLFSLLLAGFIWLTVHKIIVPQAAEISPASIPVTFGGVAVSVVGSFPTTPLYQINSNSVSVTVAGPKEVMDVLQKNQIHALIFLSDMDDPTRESMLPVSVAMPQGVTLSRVEPAAIHVTPPPKH